MSWGVGGLRVEYMVLRLINDAGATCWRPGPFEGPQFCVTYLSPVSRLRVVRGYARTAGELAALGVPAWLVRQIQGAAA